MINRGPSGRVHTSSFEVLIPMKKDPFIDGVPELLVLRLLSRKDMRSCPRFDCYPTKPFLLEKAVSIQFSTGLWTIPEKFTIQTFASWTIFIGSGGLILWIILSFLVYLPIDESKVHPDLARSDSASPDPRWLAYPRGRREGNYVDGRRK